MTTQRCPVCGTDKGACGDQPLVLPVVDLAPLVGRGATSRAEVKLRPQRMYPGTGHAAYRVKVDPERKP